MRHILTILVTLIAFSFLSACSAEDARRAAQAELKVAEQISDVRSGIANILDDWPDDESEQYRLVSSVITLLPTKYQEKANAILDTSTNARDALEDIRTGWLARVESTAIQEADRLTQLYEDAEDKKARAWNTALTIGGGILAILTGGATVGMKRANTALTQVVKGVEKSELSDNMWRDKVAPSLRAHTDESTKIRIAKIKARLET